MENFKPGLVKFVSCGKIMPQKTMMSANYNTRNAGSGIDLLK